MVIDASACVELLLKTPAGAKVAAEMRDKRLRAPHLIDIEVVQVFRRLVAQHVVTEERAELALRRLQRLRMKRYETRALTLHLWGFRDNLSAYDASYVCLAASLHVPLITCDAKLARAVGDKLAVVCIGTA